MWRHRGVEAKRRRGVEVKRCGDVEAYRRRGREKE